MDDSMNIHPCRELHGLPQTVSPQGILAEQHIWYLRGSEGYKNEEASEERMVYQVIN